MKHFALALCAVTAVASAQTPEDDRARGRISQAYEAIRSSGDFSLSISGTDSMPGRTDDLRSDLFWHVGDDNVPRVEVLSYRNNSLTSRIVGDGQILWSYSPVRNEYSTYRYVTSGRDPIVLLLNALGSAARGHEAYAVRTLREIQSVMPPRWRPLAGAVPMDRNAGPYDEPDEDVLYRLGDPVRRQVFYDLQAPASDGSTGWTLFALYFYDLTRMGSRNRELNLTLVRGTVEPDRPFTFVPPARARPVRG